MQKAQKDMESEIKVLSLGFDASRDDFRQRDDEHRETIAKVDEKLETLMAMVQISVESKTSKFS